jgi:tRNA(adenine34) deaminase
MREALVEADRAEGMGEVPVGAVVVRSGRIIGRGHNRSITDRDPSGHAEIVALREVARGEGNHRLPGAQMFVTIEPCPMCAGALLQARVRTLVFGARDPKAGAVRSLHSLLEDPRHNHRVEVVEGILADECSGRLRDFFRKKRHEKPERTS